MCLLSLPALGQSQYAWTGSASDGDWANAANWLNNSKGGIISGFPSLNDSATFPIGASIFGGTADSVFINKLLTLENHGHLMVQDTLDLDGAFIENSAGEIELGPETSIRMDNAAWIQGGRITGVGVRGQIVGQTNTQCTLRDVTFSGDVAVRADIAGTITIENDAHFGGSSGSSRHVGIESDVTTTLQGPGTLTLGSDVFGIGDYGKIRSSEENPGTLLNQLEGGITGRGEFESLTLINKTEVRPGSDSITFIHTSIDNTDGRFEIGDNSGEYGQINLLGNTILDGGEIFGYPGARLHGRSPAMYKDVHLMGEFELENFYRSRFKGVTLNDASLTLRSNGQSGGGILILDNEVAHFKGTGELVMAGTRLNSGNGAILGKGNTSRLILDNHVIRGEGTIAYMTVENRGLLLADSGNFMLRSSTVENENGHIEIKSGSTLRLGGTIIKGGTVHGEPGSMYASALLVNQGNGTFEDVTLTGEIIFGEQRVGGLSFLDNTSLQGTVTNNAKITVVNVPDGDIDPGHRFSVWFDTTATLAGTGEIILHESAYGGIFGNGKERSTLIHEPPHRIIGSSWITRINLDNRSTIMAQNGTLLFKRTVLTSSGPLIALDGGIIRFEESVVSAETIEIANGGAFEFLNSELEVNHFVGDIEIQSGDFSAGIGLSTSTISGDYTQTHPLAYLNVSMNAETREHDRVHVLGDATLAGNLQLTTTNWDSIRNGDTFEILQVDGIRSGTFAGLNEGSLAMSYGGGAAAGGVDLYITYAGGSGNSIVLYAVAEDDCPGDLTDDGILDFFDVSAFLDAFGMDDPIADFTNDGLFDFFDVIAFLDAFGAGCP